MPRTTRVFSARQGLFFGLNILVTYSVGGAVSKAFESRCRVNCAFDGQRKRCVLLVLRHIGGKTAVSTEMPVYRFCSTL